MADGEGAGAGALVVLFEQGDDVLDCAGRVVVEDVRSAEFFHEGVVFGRGGRDDGVAGGSGELDRVAADAGGAALGW